MTGPLFFTLHPHRRRARLLLPFAAAILLGPLACTDQPTESTAVQSAPIASSTRPHPYLKLRGDPSSMRAAAGLKMSASVAAASVSNTGPRVLVLADVEGVPSTDALIQRFDAEGFRITTYSPEYLWNGFNPALSDFDVVVHLNGATYDSPLAPSVQQALNSFVLNGGGFIAGQWNGSESALGQQVHMPSLVLQGYYDETSENGADLDVTYSAVPEQADHAVLAGIPASFTFHADGHDAGPAVGDSTVLMRVSSGGAAVLVRQLGDGRVVNFSFAANYPNYDLDGNLKMVTLLDGNVQQLYVNAVKWSSEASGLADQTITFDDLGDRTFGDLPFTVSATSTSGLAVTFTAAGMCTIQSASVTITGAGTCTITAHQAGDASFNPALDVERQFVIAKAPATLALSDLSYVYNGSPRSATVTVNPAGLFGVSITYNGSVTPPTNAGSYAVTATFINANYQATPVTGTLLIAKATATLAVGTEFVFDGTPKSAVVSTTPAGLSGVALSYTQNGLPVTSPTNAGTYLVVAHLENPNYQALDGAGTLTITQATPVIQWQPASVVAGIPLRDEQLNATATGVGNSPLAGTFSYTPKAGAVLDPGPQSLTVAFAADDRNNYKGVSKTVTVSVAYRYSGFFNVKNPPKFNTVRAGRAIPLKFSLGGFQGLKVLKTAVPTSSVVACSSAPSENLPEEDVSGSGLRVSGSTYTYVWKTSESWAGTCRKVVVTLADGTAHAALFRFVKKLPKESKGHRGGNDDRDDDRGHNRDR